MQQLVDHEITVVETGVVVHTFIYDDKGDLNFNEKVLALTAAKSRREDAYHVRLTGNPR